MIVWTLFTSMPPGNLSLKKVKRGRHMQYIHFSKNKTEWSTAQAMSHDVSRKTCTSTDIHTKQWLIEQGCPR